MLKGFFSKVLTRAHVHALHQPLASGLSLVSFTPTLAQGLLYHGRQEGGGKLPRSHRNAPAAHQAPLVPDVAAEVRLSLKGLSVDSVEDADGTMAARAGPRQDSGADEETLQSLFCLLCSPPC